MTFSGCTKLFGFIIAINNHITLKVRFEKGKPIVRLGRKDMGLWNKDCRVACNSIMRPMLRY
jgi:hypothetical protein